MGGGIAFGAAALNSSSHIGNNITSSLKAMNSIFFVAEERGFIT